MNVPLSERRAAIVETLRSVGWVAGEDDDWMYRVAGDIEQENPAGWACCPLCEEITCDDGCPVRPLRLAAGIDHA